MEFCLLTWTFLCVQQMHMRGCHVFCASMHQRVPYEKTQDLQWLRTINKNIYAPLERIAHGGNNQNAVV